MNAFSALMIFFFTTFLSDARVPTAFPFRFGDVVHWRRGSLAWRSTIQLRTKHFHCHCVKSIKLELDLSNRYYTLLRPNDDFDYNESSITFRSVLS